MITKQSVMRYIVPRAGVAIPNGVAVGGVTVAANSRLVDVTTEDYSLPFGSFGFYAPVAGSGNPREVSGVNTPVLKVIQRRDTRNDRSPLYERVLEESPWISANCAMGVNITATAPESPRNHIVLVGGQVGTVNQIQVLDEFDYIVQTSLDGDRVDLYNSIQNRPTVFGRYTSPDFTTPNILTQNQRLDVIVSSLTADYNLQSYGNRALAVAMAISYTGGVTGGIPVATAAALPVGSRLLIGYTETGDRVDVTITIGIQNALIALQAQLVALGAAAAEIRPYVLPGTTPVAGIATAGTTTGTAVADFIAFLSIDYTEAYYDFKMNLKNKIRVGQRQGFGTSINVIASSAREGRGLGRQLYIDYEKREQYHQLQRPRVFQADHIEFPNELKKDGSYDIFTIEHCDERSSNGGMPTRENFTTVIAVLSFEDPSTPYFTGTANPQKTYVRNILNAFNTNNVLGNVAL